MTKKPSSLKRIPSPTTIVTAVKFFEASDIDDLLSLSEIEPPKDLHYAGKDDPDAPPGVWAESLATRCAMDLHEGLNAFVTTKLQLEFYPANNAVAEWAKEVLVHTDPLMQLLGWKKSDLVPEGQHPSLLEMFYPLDAIRWEDRIWDRIGLFGQAVGARKAEIEEDAGDAAREAFESFSVGAEEIAKTAYAVRVLHEVAQQTADYNDSNQSKPGPKPTLVYFFRAIMSVYTDLTGDYASVPYHPIKEVYYGPELAFTQECLKMAIDRLVDGTFRDGLEAISLARFREELESASTPEAIAKKFREINKALKHSELRDEKGARSDT